MIETLNQDPTTKSQGDEGGRPAPPLFGFADWREFQRQFVVQFLASWCAANFADFCSRGYHDALSKPPVEDAELLAQDAWKHWCATMMPNA